VIDVGLNVPVAPVGNPLTLNVTLPLNPFSAPTLTVYVVLPPAATVCVLGVALIVKSGVNWTTGTIWIPFTGARCVPSEAVLGIPDNVNPLTFGIVNTT
jgi:hypothetical protein